MKKISVILIVLVLLASFSNALAVVWEDREKVCPNCHRETTFTFAGRYYAELYDHYPIYYCILEDCLWTDAYMDVFAPHEGGVATCTEEAVCEVCNEPYGKPLGHYYGEWTSNDDGTHSAVCRRCSKSAIRVCGGEEGGICPVCGSGEYELIGNAKATGKTMPPRGELCVRYAPDKGIFISWEYAGKTEPILSPLTVSIPVKIEGDFTIPGVDFTYENERLIVTIEETMFLEIIR